MRHATKGTAPRGWEAGPTTDELAATRIAEVEDLEQPLTDDEIRALGYEPLGWCWRATTDDARASIDAAAARTGSGSYTGPSSFRIPGTSTCCVCGELAGESTVGTPTCGAVCTSIVMHRLLPVLEEHLSSRGDGSGGLPPRRPVPPRPRKRLSVVPTGPISVDRALERLVDCRTVLERHGVDVRWGRAARCPLHDDTHPSMGLYTSTDGKSKAHCFPCDFDGDALDLEAAIAGEDVNTTIRRWGGQ